MPTSHPRHSITETPALAAVLEPLRRRLGDDAPSLSDLVLVGAQLRLRELDARDAAVTGARASFVTRLAAEGEPDLEEIQRIRTATRLPR